MCKGLQYLYVSTRLTAAAAQWFREYSPKQSRSLHRFRMRIKKNSRRKTLFFLKAKNKTFKIVFHKKTKLKHFLSLTNPIRHATHAARGTPNHSKIDKMSNGSCFEKKEQMNEKLPRQNSWRASVGKKQTYCTRFSQNDSQTVLSEEKKTPIRQYLKVLQPDPVSHQSPFNRWNNLTIENARSTAAVPQTRKTAK